MSDEDLKHIKKVEDLTSEELDKLTTQQAKMPRDRFGIESTDDLSIKDVRELFDKTRARIEEIEEKALKKLHGEGDDPDAS